MKGNKFIKEPLSNKGNKFIKAPLSNDERNKKIDEFISLNDGEDTQKRIKQERHKKEKTKTVYLRAPESLWGDIHDVMALTGLSMNAICLDLLRPEIKRRLKELRDD